MTWNAIGRSVDHVSAHHWLENLGAQRECLITDMGINRDCYLQYAWTRSKADEVYVGQNVYIKLSYTVLEMEAQIRSCFRQFHFEIESKIQTFRS